MDHKILDNKTLGNSKNVRLLARVDLDKIEMETNKVIASVAEVASKEEMVVDLLQEEMDNKVNMIQVKARIKGMVHEDHPQEEEVVHKDKAKMVDSVKN
jgi:hypothetical protein